MRKSPPRTNLAGKRFGKLLVTNYVGGSKWECICDCGKTTNIITANLNRKNSQSCGCVRNIKSSKRATKHGLYHTQIYKSWCSIKKRCYNPNDTAYPNYGGMGIKMYDKWVNDPKAFFDYLGHEPQDGKEYSVDRIDNKKGYEPGNVRWATNKQQSRNRSICVKVSFQENEFDSISEFIDWLMSQTNIKRNSLMREFQKKIKV